MNDIRTYAVGNGEITLSAQDAEDLRIMLQTEHLRKVINELIDERADQFNFPGRRSLHRFIDEIVRLHDDLINYDSLYYEETIMENIYARADEQNLLR